MLRELTFRCHSAGRKDRLLLVDAIFCASTCVGVGVRFNVLPDKTMVISEAGRRQTAVYCTRGQMYNHSTDFVSYFTFGIFCSRIRHAFQIFIACLYQSKANHNRLISGRAIHLRQLAFLQIIHRCIVSTIVYELQVISRSLACH